MTTIYDLVNVERLNELVDKITNKYDYSSMIDIYMTTNAFLKICRKHIIELNEPLYNKTKKTLSEEFEILQRIPHMSSVIQIRKEYSC